MLMCKEVLQLSFAFLEISSDFGLYAHIEIFVAFLVVNFFGFLVITRHHEGLKRPY